MKINMESNPKKKYGKLLGFFIDVDKMENPSSDTNEDSVKLSKLERILGWIIFFLVTHAWWILLAFIVTFCEGAAGMGYSCTIPIENLAVLHEISVIFLGIPIFLPIIFYAKLIGKFRSRSSRQ